MGVNKGVLVDLALSYINGIVNIKILISRILLKIIRIEANAVSISSLTVNKAGIDVNLIKHF